MLEEVTQASTAKIGPLQSAFTFFPDILWLHSSVPPDSAARLFVFKWP